MSAADVAVAVVAALIGLLVAPFAQRLIDAVPPDPEDDPPPVRRAGPWLARSLSRRDAQRRTQVTER